MGSCSEERNSDLKLSLKFAKENCCKLFASFWEEGVGFYFGWSKFYSEDKSF